MRSYLTKIKLGVFIACGLCMCGTGFAQDANDDPDQEIVIVTAQRVNEDIQDVPIAVTALTGEMLEDQQVITPSDIQLNVPSVSFTSTNFGGASFAIRGVGSLVIGSASEAGVSAHMNEIAVRSNLNTIEFFDMERVEVLRGPQGTLFGRNATGGAINFVTMKPEFNVNSATIDVEAGSGGHERLKGIFNLSVSDNFGLRVAGFSLKREGYTENLAYGQVGKDGTTIPNIKSKMDGRNIEALRVTARFELTEGLSGWILGSYFNEDDDRARITNQVCKRNPLPTTGCLPNEFGYDTPHLGATTAGIFAGAGGVIPFGVDGSDSSLYNWVQPEITNLRQIHTDVQPVFSDQEKLVAWGVDYEYGDYNFAFTGAVREAEYLSQQDYVVDVGPIMQASPFNPTGDIYPVSRPDGRVGGEWIGDGCNMNAARSGYVGGCTLDLELKRVYSYDQSSANREDWILELKANSQLPGPINFHAGVSSFRNQGNGDYYVLANSLDIVSVFGAPLLGLPPLYPGYFLNSSDPEDGELRKGEAIFGEIYYDIGESTKLTAGLRFNDDLITRNGTSVLFNAINQVVVLVNSIYPAIHQLVAAQLGIPIEFLPIDNAIQAAVAIGLLAPNHQVSLGIADQVYWSRATNLLLGPFGSATGIVNELNLARLYGVSQAEIDAALLTPAYSDERIAVSNQIPIVPQFNESRILTGSPTESSFAETSGRIGIDHKLNADTLIYGFIAKGYKPGGLNPAIPIDFQNQSDFTFGAEDVLSLEGGVKSRLLDNNLTLNASVFTYDYTGLQTTRIKNNSSITENIDATLFGLELEGNFRLPSLPDWSLDFAYSLLNSSIKGSESIDPVNRTASNPDWITLNNIDPGALTATNYIAREDQITNQVVLQALQTGGAVDIRNGGTVTNVSYPVNEHGVSIPAYFSQNFLRALGVETSEGLPTNLDGNQLPQAPENTISFGLSYSQPMPALDGTLIYRWDYYWQSATYAREFNTGGDEIDSWDQHNLSLVFEGANDQYSVKFWVRNVSNDDNVTGHYLTSDTSGFYRNYFLTEPRIYGLSARYTFGG